MARTRKHAQNTQETANPTDAPVETQESNKTPPPSTPKRHGRRKKSEETQQIVEEGGKKGRKKKRDGDDEGGQEKKKRRGGRKKKEESGTPEPDFEQLARNEETNTLRDELTGARAERDQLAARVAELEEQARQQRQSKPHLPPPLDLSGEDPSDMEGEGGGGREETPTPDRHSSQRIPTPTPPPPPQPRVAPPRQPVEPSTPALPSSTSFPPLPPALPLPPEASNALLQWIQAQFGLPSPSRQTQLTQTAPPAQQSTQANPRSSAPPSTPQLTQVPPSSQPRPPPQLPSTPQTSQLEPGESSQPATQTPSQSSQGIDYTARQAAIPAAGFSRLQIEAIMAHSSKKEDFEKAWKAYNLGKDREMEPVTPRGQRAKKMDSLTNDRQKAAFNLASIGKAMYVAAFSVNPFMEIAEVRVAFKPLWRAVSSIEKTTGGKVNPSPYAAYWNASLEYKITRRIAQHRSNFVTLAKEFCVSVMHAGKHSPSYLLEKKRYLVAPKYYEYDDLRPYYFSNAAVGQLIFQNFSRSRYFMRYFEADFDIFLKRLFTPTMILFAFTAVKAGLERLRSTGKVEQLKDLFFELKSLWLERQSFKPISPPASHLTECDNIADYLYAMVRERAHLHWQIFAQQHKARANKEEKSAETEQEKPLTQEEFNASEMETFLQEACVATTVEVERVRTLSTDNPELDLEAVRDYLADQFGEEQSVDTLSTQFIGKDD
ncbi:hypothetical protein BJ508DRAFT_329753 [Ascobolus immersus RN42]|uniref:Uncharacterized protein n=1 Tax=Ascobolus immersus RN42 TaxID=1160509 RepID=A0A3N4HVN5_ASCIM|nr:hypothetical protein BJ508DRAFT_329753 [Ascobolus immersus RN42]